MLDARTPDAGPTARREPSAAPPADGTEAYLAIPRDLLWLTPRYEFVRELGRGVATVYLARERGGATPGREVAVKVVPPQHAGDPETRERLAREARTAMTFRHPHIVRTFAFETEGDAVAIVSEFVRGQTLRQALQAHGPFSFDQAAGVLRDVGAALAHAHAAGFVHRDVKPENIFIETGTGQPGTGRALLGDFGIARPIDADAHLTQEGAALGTPAYMAPEQVDGLPVDERTDVYALGLIGWEMLTGRRPWQGESLYVLLQKQRSENLPDLARLRPDVPLYLYRAITGALAKDPADRWQSAEEMLIQLAPIPEREQDAFAEPAELLVTGDGLDLEERAAVVAGTDTVRFASGELEAIRQASPPQATLAVDPDVYLRDAAAIAALPRRRRGPGRGLAALGVVALAAAVAAAAVRSHGTRSRDPQLDSLLARTAAPDSTVAPRVAPSAQAGESTAAGSPPPSAAAAPAATPPAAAPADPCRSTAPGAQRRCLLALINRHDVALNRTYTTLIHALQQRAGGAADPPGVRALRTEQRAWVDARDRVCASQTPAPRDGRWGVARAPCYAGFSDRRTAVLSARLRGRLPMAQ